MKRLLLLVLSLLLILSCVSCAEGESSAAKTTAEEQKTTDPTTQTIGTTEEPATTEEPKDPSTYETKTLKVAEHMNDVFRALGIEDIMIPLFDGEDLKRFLEMVEEREREFNEKG